MDYPLLMLFICCLIGVFVVIWISRKYFTITETQVLHLDNDRDMIVEPQLKAKEKRSMILTHSEKEIINQLLSQLYGVNPDEDLLVVGTDLEDQYFKLTNGINLREYSGSTKDSSCNRDIVFKLRHITGKNCDIAVIHDPHLRLILTSQNNYDLIDLETFLKSSMVTKTRDYLSKILEERWLKIMEFQDNNNPWILNNRGSYLYINQSVIPNTKMLPTDNGYRINLLCSELEFQALLKRLNTFRNQRLLNRN